MIDGTREELAAIARAELAAWKREPARREVRPATRRPRIPAPLPVRREDGPLEPSGTGPADPGAIADLLDALTLRSVGTDGGLGSRATGSPRVLVEQLIAREDLSDERIARVTDTTVDYVREARERLGWAS